MRILIGIATYKRGEKLLRLLRSLKRSTYKDFGTIIVADNNDTTTEKCLRDNGYHEAVMVQPMHKYVIGAWNRVVKESFIPGLFDGFMGLCDDVELCPDAIEQAVNRMKLLYPDTDGVIGFNQVCEGYPEYTFKWYGQTLMGRKFIERYKEVDYQICNPVYKHFYQDEEMFEYASSLGKFYCCPEATLNHYHPSFIREEVDETHGIVRFGENSPKVHDIKEYNNRKRLGLIWGKSWELR